MMIGRVLITSTTVAAGLTATATASAAVVNVSNASELQNAISSASPGDEITLAAGTYALPQKVNCNNAGTAAQKIVVRAANLGDAKIEFSGGTVEGFNVSAPHWVFENLEIEGTCGNDSSCEHAWHVVGNAEFTTIRNNRVYNFNAQIKANGQGTPRVFPDDVLVEFNEFYSEAPRQTSNPVTPIDVVGGRRWIVRGNYIHDFAKAQGNTISYAAFLKGNSRDGIFERNLIVCEMLHSGQTRLGLSFGGGGSSPENICEGGTCTPEHQNGIMRNNIIAHCPSDVGIYVNKGQNTRLFNNIIYDTTGIDFRFSATTGVARNNILSGDIRDRNGATSMGSNNLTGLSNAQFGNIFTNPDNLDFTLQNGTQIVDQGMNLGEVTDDFCANDRNDGSNDIGAVEFDGDGPCDTTAPGGGGSGGSGGSGMGGSAGVGGGQGGSGQAGSGTGGASGSGTGGNGTGGTAGSGTGGSGTGGGSGGTTSTGGSTATGGSGGSAGGSAGSNASNGSSSSGDDGGCGCRTPRNGSGARAGVSGLLLALLIGARRRRDY